MTRQLALVLAGLVCVLVAAGELARAAVPPPPAPNDANPWWSWDTRELAFQRERYGLSDAQVVPSGHGRAHFVAPGMPRGWRPGGGGLLVDFADGTGTGIFAADGTPLGGFRGHVPSWSPDGGRVAYLLDGDLHIANATGGGDRTLGGAARPSWDVAGPVWSPDGSEIAIATTAGLAVFEADGSGRRIVFSGANQSVNPSWSADGKTIAFERNDQPHWMLWLVGADGGDAHPISSSAYNSRLPQWSPVGDRLAFISDRQHLPGGATQYQFALYTQRIGWQPVKLLDDVHPQWPARWSPTAAEIAVAAGQECKRWGIYVLGSDAGRGRRVSNICRFIGGSGADVLHGTAYRDVLVGGPGRDRIVAGAGNDRVEARDGFRDVVDCGPGLDIAVVDRLDVVRGCEHVLRP